MSQSLTKGDHLAPQATGSDILHPSLPDAKAVPAGLTLEGINLGETE
jgi:hypothetical protein